MGIRAYEVSKKMGISSKDLVKILKDNGFDVASHMSILSDEAVKFLDTLNKNKQLDKSDKLDKSNKLDTMPSKTEIIEQKKASPVASVSTADNIINSESDKNILAKKKLDTIKTIGVITAEEKREEKKVEPVKAANQVSQASQMQQAILDAAKSAEITIVLAPMTVADFAQKANKPVNEVILTLIRQGVLASKNNLLNEKQIINLAQAYSIKTVEQPKVSKEIVGQKRAEVQGYGKSETRLPIVVIMGHVDHGKTTLLDYIRKTRVAAKEKGGITQHLGAYEVKTAQGGIVFLDTPGHEAFSMMRIRGAKVADIAVLIVAADDGVMPQTIEAIKQAKAAGLSIVVAINKIDKATPAQIETVKKQLAQHDLVLEEWGGSTVAVKLSAKTGAGVNDLLDILVLQSQLMELAAHPEMPAQGFVLESKIEKGRGPVATVICHNGTLKIGDRFIAGHTSGKVNSLVNSDGQRVFSVLPSVPVSVGGFDELPRVGDEFKVVSAQEARTGKANISLEQKIGSRQAPSKDAINIIIKTEGVSSQEALIGSVSKISAKFKKDFYIVHAAVGAINESDIILASDTRSLIYGMHVKVEPNALALSQKLNVKIKLFDIIYKLLEDLENLIELGKPVKIIKKKIGEASVLKVFDIKNLGVIAGAQILSGRFSKDGTVIIWRGKQKVGEGSIKSLQRDKKAVKEVHTGFECAFLINGFDAWQVGDRVECFLESVDI